MGEVIGESDNPIVAINEILDCQPSIVLIDLLMPIQDGIETVLHLKDKGILSKFIMISQIENKDMVGKAYEAGIEYFIHKPINRVEVKSIISNVLEKIKLEKSINTIRESLSLISSNEPHKKNTLPDLEKIIREILTDLGILGESGSSDIMDLMKFLIENKPDIESTPLKVLYMDVLKARKQDTSEKEAKTFEQRLRRAINQALINLASLGLTDYTHPKFELYASKFFDFSEVRLKMNELDEKKYSRNSRSNIRKFLYAFYVEVQGRL